MASLDKMSVKNLLAKGIEFQNNGELNEADKYFQEALKKEPNNPAVQYSICSIETAKGNYKEALVNIEKALAYAPNFDQAHLAHSIVLYYLGKIDEAIEAVNRSIKLSSSSLAAKNHLNTLQILKQGDLNNTTSENINSLNATALQLQAAGSHLEAEVLFRRVVTTDPKNFTALYSLGVARSSQGDFTSALDFFSRASESLPSSPLGHFAKAKVLHDLGLAEDAIIAYDNASAADPCHMDTYTNKAALLQSLNRHHEALVTLVRASEIQPNHLKSLEGQGLLLGQFKEFGLAIKAFESALKVDPNYDYGLGNLLSAKLGNCDWSDYDVLRNKIIDGINLGARTCGPMTIMAVTDDVEVIKKCINLYASVKYPISENPMWNGEVYSHRKKRIAFISGDFRIHPVGYLFIGLLENLDKNKFSTTGIYTGVTDGSELWKRYRCAFDNYIDSHMMTDYEVASLVRSMEIDVLIDLSGHTEGTRLSVLAHKPAPVQCTYLGFPGTLGLPFIDKLISDNQIIPHELEKHYFEDIVKLNHCYLPRDNTISPSDVIRSRSEYGLPEIGFVFCSFNHDYKINPPIFEVWMQLLKEIPDSVLWLMKLNNGAHENLKMYAIQHGVDASRIYFAERVASVEEHLARYRLADLFIDTFPYNGHTTVSDALRSGLPVVTMLGNSFSSRVAFSLLHDLGLDEFACKNYDSYYNTCLNLATNNGLLTNYKNRLDQLIPLHWPPSLAEQASSFEDVLSIL